MTKTDGRWGEVWGRRSARASCPLFVLSWTIQTHREKYSLEQDIREKEEAIRQKTNEVQVSTRLVLVGWTLYQMWFRDSRWG